jgi:hypothetical protein
MRNLRLRAIEDEEFGHIGLKFVVPHKLCTGRFTIANGLQLAHDIIEHQQGHQKIGSIGDEMVALGGICYTRGQWGDISRDGSGAAYSVEENIASDLHGMMANLYFENGVPFRQKLVKSRDEDPSGFVDAVIECARENWSDRYERWELMDDVPNQEQIDTYLEDCRTFMLHGSKLAARRFGSGILANDMFWEIQNKTDNLIKSIEYEGQEFLLGYDFNINIRFNEVDNGDY